MAEDNEGDTNPTPNHGASAEPSVSNIGHGHTPIEHFPREQVSGCVGMLRNFTGQDVHHTAIHFLQEVEDVARIGNWGELTKLVVVRSKLRERAAEILAENEELRICADFETFKRLFLECFQPEEPAVVRMNRFISCKQLPHQDVRQYVTTLKNRAAQYFGTRAGNSLGVDDTFRDETTLCQFLQGLKREIREVVTRRYPRNFNEAVHMALAEEQSAKLLGGSHRVNTVAETGGSGDADALTRSIQQLLRRMDITDRNVARMQEAWEESRRRDDARHDRERRGQDRYREHDTGQGRQEARGTDRYRSQDARYYGRGERIDMGITCYGCRARGHKVNVCPQRQHSGRNGTQDGGNQGRRNGYPAEQGAIPKQRRNLN